MRHAASGSTTIVLAPAELQVQADAQSTSRLISAFHIHQQSFRSPEFRTRASSVDPDSS